MEIQSSKALRAKPTFVEIGGEKRISSGRWNEDLMAQYLVLHALKKWVPISELARVAYGSAMTRNKILVRGKLRKLLINLQKMNYVLLIQYDPPRGRAMFVKVFNYESTEDQQAAQYYIDKQIERGELALTEARRAREIVRAIAA